MKCYRCNKEVPQQNTKTIFRASYFRGRLKGNNCENCRITFEEGDMIFTPEQISYDGEKITRYFCNYQCSLNNDI